MRIILKASGIIMFGILVVLFVYHILISVSASYLAEPLTDEEIAINHKMTLFCDSLKLALKCEDVIFGYSLHERLPWTHYSVDILYEENQFKILKKQYLGFLRKQSFNIANNLTKRMLLKESDVSHIVIRWECNIARSDLDTCYTYFSFSVDSLNHL